MTRISETRVQTLLRNKSQRLITISATASIREAAELLYAEQVGVLLVIDGAGELVGLLSEGHIVNFVAKQSLKQSLGGLDFAVTAAMAIDWISATPDDSVASLTRVMTEERARYVPVVSNGKLVGVISLGDILKSRLVAQDDEAIVPRAPAVDGINPRPSESTAQL